MVRTARTIKEVPKEKPIETIIDECYEKRNVMAQAKKIEGDLASKIKSYFKDNNLSKFDSGKVVAKVSQSESLSLDEEGLIRALKQKVANKELPKTVLKRVVQTREYIDSDNLEDAIYNGLLSANELAPFQIVKTVDKLTFKKV
jgi:hypothetical protein